LYNRYIPSADGTYRRQIVPSEEKKEPSKQPAPTVQPAKISAAHTPTPAFPKTDSGDILVLLILLLILLEGEDTDPISILITLAAFFLMQ